MFLVVGLGNPGRKYDGTRHNVGFETITVLAHRHRFPVSIREMDAEVSKGTIGNVDVLLVKPMTYMNLSGDAVGALALHYDVQAADTIVIHDELDFEPGQVRIKSGGGHGGNNGLRSIVSRVGRDFSRVRIGIGKPPDTIDGADWVLSPPSPSERDVLGEAVQRAVDAVEAIVGTDVRRAMNEFNRKPKQVTEEEDSKTEIPKRSTGTAGDSSQGE